MIPKNREIMTSQNILQICFALAVEFFDRQASSLEPHLEEISSSYCDTPDIDLVGDYSKDSL